MSPITICLWSLNIHLHHSLWNTWTVMALYYGPLLTLSDVLFSLCFCRYVGCFCHYVVCFCRYVGCFCCYLGCFCCDVGCIMTITLLYWRHLSQVAKIDQFKKIQITYMYMVWCLISLIKMTLFIRLKTVYLFIPRDRRSGAYCFCPVCHSVILFKTLTLLITSEQ